MLENRRRGLANQFPALRSGDCSFRRNERNWKEAGTKRKKKGEKETKKEKRKKQKGRLTRTSPGTHYTYLPRALFSFHSLPEPRIDGYGFAVFLLPTAKYFGHESISKVVMYLQIPPIRQATEADQADGTGDRPTFLGILSTQQLLCSCAAPSRSFCFFAPFPFLSPVRFPPLFFMLNRRPVELKLDDSLPRPCAIRIADKAHKRQKLKTGGETGRKPLCYERGRSSSSDTRHEMGCTACCILSFRGTGTESQIAAMCPWAAWSLRSRVSVSKVCMYVM